MQSCFRRLAITAVTLGCSLTAAAQDKKWWPLDVFDGLAQGKVISYSPVEKAQKPWKLCVLFPHMKDSFWAGVDYGIVDEARRLGVNVVIYEAGGYDQLPRQLSQFDDCRASKADAIILGAISEAGLKQKLEEAHAAKIPVIGTANPIANAPTEARVHSSFEESGAASAKGLLQRLNGRSANVLLFPGPQGSGWAEGYRDGFVQAVKGSKVKILETKWGVPDVGVQIKLVQDALQAYPTADVIWGGAPAVEAAITAVQESGRSNISIVAAYENQAIADAVKRGDILGFASSYPVVSGRIAVDQAIRVLERKPVTKYVMSIPHFVGKDNFAKTDVALIFAPPGFRPVYRVQAGK